MLPIELKSLFVLPDSLVVKQVRWKSYLGFRIASCILLVDLTAWHWLINKGTMKVKKTFNSTYKNPDETNACSVFTVILRGKNRKKTVYEARLKRKTEVGK
jgi:hypothetical protein